jgi:type IV secretion system protein VirB8
MAISGILARKPKKSIVGAEMPASKKSTGIDPDDDLAVGKWYLEQARQFEKNKRDGERREVKIAWRVGIAGVVFAAISLIGTVSLAVLKRPNPPAVLRVDASTGKVDVLPTTANGHVSWDEKNDRADLRRYVEARESYDWETINDMHDFVMLESDDHEKGLYDAFIRGPRGPLKVLKDSVRVIANVSVITFVNDTAQVFFSKRVVQLNAGAITPEPEYWIATISFKRENVPESTDAQDLDPTGFRVTSYRVDRDWSRAPAQSQPPARGK